MNVVAFDLETTGLDTQYAKIVEIGVICDGDEFHSPVNPGIPIQPEATAVHGITDEDVKDAPTFPMIAEQVQQTIEGAVLVGYSSRSFDTLILHRELSQAGQAAFDLETVEEIDLWRVWREAEPRTLVGAMQRYLQVDMGEDAHRARADTSALMLLLPAMQRLHGLTLEQMLAMSRPADEVDRSGKLRRREDGEIVFTFGKWKDRPVSEHRDYAEWALSADFPADTCRALRELLAVAP